VSFLAADFPPVEFLIFIVFLLIGLLGKLVEIAKRVRDRSLEQQRREGELAPEPPKVEEPPPPPAATPRPVEPPPAVGLPFRLMPVRRPPRRRREPPPAVVPRPFIPAIPASPARPIAPLRQVHPAVRLVRKGPESLRQAIVLAEILGPPKARRRSRLW